MSVPRIAVIVSGFPRRSETFALAELLALDARGELAGLFATKPGDLDGAQPGAERLTARVEVLPDAGPEEQARIVADRLRGRAVDGVHGYFAHAPADVRARVSATLVRVTPYTITQPGRLTRQLRQVLRDYYATTVEEMSLGACSLGVPIRAGDEVVAALGIVVPSLKKDRARLVSAMQVAARSIGLTLGGPGTSVDRFH